MTTYENAPATKLLATHCACCGRALVDAVSVETGIGPECRKRYGVTLTVDGKTHDEANALVHAVARRGVTKVECRAICTKLRALGFDVLADRILKRFHLTAVDTAALEAARKVYRAILVDATYDNATATEFNAAVVALGAVSPEDFVRLAEVARCKCKRCCGTGAYITGSLNGQPSGPGGDCFRCGGRGTQSVEDARRNRAYDAYQAGRGYRAA